MRAVRQPGCFFFPQKRVDFLPEATSAHVWTPDRLEKAPSVGPSCRDEEIFSKNDFPGTKSYVHSRYQDTPVSLSPPTHTCCPSV